MQYKALIVDVDGTLMSPTNKIVSQPVVAGLTGLQARGIPVIVATGRSPFATRPAVLSGFQPDYLIGSNGAYLADGAGQVLWEQTMSHEQFEAVCALGRGGASIGFSFAEGYYCYFNSASFMDFFAEFSGDMDAIRATDHARHLHGLPHAAFGLVERAAAERFNAARTGMRMTGYTSVAYDINQIDCNKATCTERLLALLGLSWGETVFIGDGENDIELLRAAGLGVAMGNAKDSVKACADLVADTVYNNGVARIVQTLF